MGTHDATTRSPGAASSSAENGRKVAWILVLIGDEMSDHDAAISLAEEALAGIPEQGRADALGTLGAALYRAGRFEEAIRRLDEGIGGQDGQGLPQNWAFLAMAHHRLGHQAEARRWLDRFRNDQAPEGGSYWNDLEIRLLRREAESLILDPAFPADPFAP